MTDYYPEDDIMVAYKRIVKQYKKGKGFQKVINLSIKDEFQHLEEVMVVSMPDYDDLTSSKADDKIAAVEDENKDAKIESLEGIITEKESKITYLTNQLQTLKEEKADAIDERKELSRKLEEKDDALIKATALLTAYENQSYLDKVLNKKPKLKEAMDIYLASTEAVSVAAEVKDDNDED
jgi:septal ring factor EnvC (AmiA/AmiB activator)